MQKIKMYLNKVQIIGFILSTTPFIISKVSIPVVPNTPGATALTGLAF